MVKIVLLMFFIACSCGQALKAQDEIAIENGGQNKGSDDWELSADLHILPDLY